MPRRGVIGLLMLLLTGLTLMSLAGHTPWDGHVLLRLTNDHGLHDGDVPVLAAWLTGVAGCAWLWRDS